MSYNNIIVYLHYNGYVYNYIVIFYINVVIIQFLNITVLSYINQKYQGGHQNEKVYFPSGCIHLNGNVDEYWSSVEYSEIVTMAEENFEASNYLWQIDSQNAQLKSYNIYGINTALYTTGKAERISNIFTTSAYIRDNSERPEKMHLLLKDKTAM